MLGHQRGSDQASVAAGPQPPASVGPCGDMCQAEKPLREGSEEEAQGSLPGTDDPEANICQ